MKTSLYLQTTASIVITGVILWFGKPFLVPLAYAFLIALVLYPMCKYFERKGANRVVAVIIPVILASIVLAGIVALLSYELVILSSKLKLIEAQFEPLFKQVQDQLTAAFGWTSEEQLNWIRENVSRLGEYVGALLKNTFDNLFTALFNLVIIPIYIIIILLFRERLVNFVMALTPESYRDGMDDFFKQTISVFAGFLRGMILVYLLVGLLNSLGLWMIGVELPFIYGMTTAIMTIIPYFGIMISASLPIILTWLETGSIWLPLGIIGVFGVVQYLEANLIFPYIVGKFINLNTMAAIFAIFLGALFWGVSGMILFLPMVAVFRLFAEHFGELKAWHILLGNDKSK
jgi:predicted PurR-regulated permease PerM